MNVTCDVCGSALRARFVGVLDPQTRKTFRIDACIDCGLGHTLPQPQSLDRFYGTRYHGGRHGFTDRYCTWRRKRFVTQRAGTGAGRRLLDLGCGDGAFLLAARQAGFAIEGVEMNPAIARAAGFTVHEALDAVRPGLDVITAWHSLEHFRSPKAMLTEAVRLLKPGGWLFVAVPNAGGLQARCFGARWFHLDVPRHLFHFGHPSLMRLLTMLGCEVEKIWNQELEFDLFGCVQSALNTLLPDPNVMFDRLTGRASVAGPVQVAASFVLGSALTALALPTVPIAALLGHGGTLVVAARKHPDVAL